MILLLFAVFYILFSLSPLYCLKNSDSSKILLKSVAKLEFKSSVSFITEEAVLTVDEKYKL